MQRMLDEAEYLRLLNRPRLDAALGRNATRTGAARLRKILAAHQPGTTRTVNRLEEAFYLLCREAGLPKPEVNQPLGPYTIDFLWREQRLAVETDGGQSHDRPGQREKDATRDAWLTARDWQPRRFTHDQVFDRPHEVLAALNAALK